MHSLAGALGLTADVAEGHEGRTIRSHEARAACGSFACPEATRAPRKRPQIHCVPASPVHRPASPQANHRSTPPQTHHRPRHRRRRESKGRGREAHANPIASPDRPASPLSHPDAHRPASPPDPPPAHTGPAIAEGQSQEVGAANPPQPTSPQTHLDQQLIRVSSEPPPPVNADPHHPRSTPGTRHRHPPTSTCGPDDALPPERGSMSHDRPAPGKRSSLEVARRSVKKGLRRGTARNPLSAGSGHFTRRIVIG